MKMFASNDIPGIATTNLFVYLQNYTVRKYMRVIPVGRYVRLTRDDVLNIVDFSGRCIYKFIKIKNAFVKQVASLYN